VAFKAGANAVRGEEGPRKEDSMNLTVGNKNVVIGLIVLMVYLSMTFFIERTAALHGFHVKAAAAVLETKNSPNLLDHQITEARKGPAYRVGGIYFTNYYPGCTPGSSRSSTSRSASSWASRRRPAGHCARGPRGLPWSE
jgi:hypothetical protein